MVPIAMFLYQFIGVVNYQQTYIDHFNFRKSVPITLPCLLFIFFIDRKLKLYALKSDLKEYIENEIEKVTNTYIKK